MKKIIYLLTLVLGIGGTAAAQSCGGGYYGENSSNTYYSSVDAVGKVNIRKRGFVDRRWVVDANIIKDRGNKISLEYVLENGDVLMVMAKRGGQGHGQGQFNYDNDPFAYGASNNGSNYYYGASNSGPRRNRGNTFTVHCVRLNGRTIANNCGTIRIEQGYGRYQKTFIDIDMGRKGKWKGNAEVRRRGRF